MHEIAHLFNEIQNKTKLNNYAIMSRQNINM